MIYICLSCGSTFSRDEAITERYIGGETEYFCPVCGSDDIETIKESKEGKQCQSMKKC